MTRESEGSGDPRTASAEDRAWGGRCGCLVAGMFGLPTLFLGIFALTFGDCEPADGCHAHDERNVLILAAVTVGIAVALRIGVGRAAAHMGERRASLLFWLAAGIAIALALGVWLNVF